MMPVTWLYRTVRGKIFILRILSLVLCDAIFVVDEVKLGSIQNVINELYILFVPYLREETHE